MGLLDKQAKAEPFMRREAEFGRDAGDITAYRYSLLRCWHEEWTEGEDPAMYWVMLNPSTADHQIDDPTIRRCMGFAKTCGFRAMYVVNLYGLRATRPVHLWEHSNPVGPENGRYLRAVLEASINVGGVVVAGWGTNARPEDVETFEQVVDAVGASVWCLGNNGDGSPKHPLYLAADTALKRWR